MHIATSRDTAPQANSTESDAPNDRGMEAHRQGTSTKRIPQVKGGRMCIMLILNAVVTFLLLRYALLGSDPKRRPAIPNLLKKHEAHPSSYSAESDPIITPEIAELAKRLMAKGNVHGLSVGVVRLQPLSSPDIEFGSWGVMSERNDNVTSDTLFSIGSCSKAFLATTMGILMKDFRTGRNRTALPPGVMEFDWNTRINDLLPDGEWGLADEFATKEATIGDALSHTTGLSRHDFAWNSHDSTLDVVRRLRHWTMAHGLRMQWNYNNQMYILASHVITRYAGMPYTRFAAERIFDALGLASTTFAPADAERSGNLSQAWSYRGRRIPLWLGADAPEMLAGPGGVISSAKDMIVWITALLGGVRNLKPSDEMPAHVLSDITTARAIVYGRAPVPNFSMIGYGMGWMRMTYHGHEVVYHGGSIPGYRTLVMLLPTQNAGIVAFANSDDWGGVHEAVAFSLLHNIVGLPPIPFPTLNANPDGRDTLLPPTPMIGLHGYHLPAAALRPTPSDSAPQSVMHADDTDTLKRYAGTYTNAGYGNLTLCAPSTASQYCDRVRAAFELVRGSNSTERDDQALLAEWPRLLATHVRLVQLPREYGQHGLWLTPHFLFPEGYGDDRTPFDYQLFPAEVGLVLECAPEEPRDETDAARAKVDGCGLFLSDETYLNRKPYLSLREQVDVWFEKVE